MPLYQEWSPDVHSLAAIWHIEEEEDFFREATGLESAIPSSRRRIEHLAGRYLLQHLKEDFPLHHIAPDAHDKPRLPEDRYLFSISHSYPYVAAVVAEGPPASSAAENPVAGDLQCGIDIQVWRPRMDRLKHKFLGPEEQVLFGADDKMLTLAWCAKEAAYKWQGRRGVDFILHLPITSFLIEAEGAVELRIRLPLVQGVPEIVLQGNIEADFAFAVAVG